MRKTGVDFEMIMPKRKPCGGADILHSESNRDANDEKNQLGPKTVEDAGMHQRTGNKDGRQNLGKRCRVPGKPYSRGQNASHRKPQDGLSRRMRPSAVCTRVLSGHIGRPLDQSLFGNRGSPRWRPRCGFAISTCWRHLVWVA